MTTPNVVSVRSLLGRFRWKVSLTFTLVILEAAVALLFPLFIGLAVDDLVDDSYRGVMALAGLGLAALAIGTVRRFYDTRAYAAIYETIAVEMVDRERDQGASVSRIAARSSLLTEFVEFLENSMPEIVASVIGVTGTLFIMLSIDLGVFAASLGLLAILVVTYWITGGRNSRLNAGYNDELERQVEAIESTERDKAVSHYSRLMRWNIRLSDLETLNYGVFFLGVIALFFYAPIALVTNGVQTGLVVSGFMYVFQYVEGLMAMPLYIQQLIRLREISSRLGAEG